MLQGSGIKGKYVVALVGSPNVGKSTLFYRLTGKYAWISNYPGTTVDITIGRLKIEGLDVEAVDTPGMHSLFAITEDERIARRILFDLKPDVVVHVVNAVNLDRMLWMTILLIEAGYNVVLVINAIDEVKKLGYRIDHNRISERLGIPVVPTVATKGIGVGELKEVIKHLLTVPKRSKKRILVFSNSTEAILNNIEKLLEKNYPVSKRIISILLALQDPEVINEVLSKEPKKDAILRILNEISSRGLGLQYVIQHNIKKFANEVLKDAIIAEESGIRDLSRVDEFLINPLTGSLVLIAVLALLYLFVGVLGAQIVVDFLEGEVFEGILDPLVESFLTTYVRNPLAYELIGGEYGIVTLGIKYAFAIIFPIVTFFFIAFSIIEDSGYLPRLALLIDRVLKKIGLSGKAVIPLVLGTGCDTMATVTTRILETRKEKVLATLMLALGVPCSAQLGVVLGLLPGFRALIIWSLIVISVLLIVAYIASKIIPGESPYFIMELPPLRAPSIENVLMKTLVRLEWYIKEVLPLFILASILIWVGRITGVFDIVISILSVPTTWIGLPKEAAVSFLYGFFRRDYGAAGFYDLWLSRALSERQILVSMVTITLFVPCIAQFSVMIKERGLKVALAIFFTIVPLAFAVGYIVNLIAIHLGM